MAKHGKDSTFQAIKDFYKVGDDLNVLKFPMLLHHNIMKDAP